MKHSAQTDQLVRRVILIEGSANLVVLIAKVIIALSTGSMAILADAIHSLTDLANNFIAWFVMRFSSEPADREHPYGHRKFETLAVFILASLLVVLAFELTLNTIRKEQAEVVSSNLQLAVMLCVLAVNIVVTIWQHRWATRLDSDLLRADATHTFADVLITSAVIAGWQLSAIGYAWADRLCAIAIALFVIYLAYSLFRRTVPVLLDQYAVEPQELRDIIKNVRGVENVYRIRSRWIGKTCSIDLTISVDPELSTKDSHDITDNIAALIEERFDTSDITIHVEPDGSQ